MIKAIKQSQKIMIKYRSFTPKMVFDLIDNKISPNFWIIRVFIQSLENLMVSIKKSKKPFKNTKIRPREKAPWVEVGSPNPRWVVLGRPRGSFNPRWSTRAASVVQPSLPARVRKPAVVYQGSTRVDMPLVNRS